METYFENIKHAHRSLASDRVVEDLRLLVRDSEDLLRATADDVSEQAKEARLRLTSALERARDTYRELQAQTVETARVAAQKADTAVRAHPYESVGVAFGVGLLIGFLVARK